MKNNLVIFLHLVPRNMSSQDYNEQRDSGDIAIETPEVDGKI